MTGSTDQDYVAGNPAIVSGWGNSTPVTTHLRSPLDAEQVLRCIPPGRPLIARGMGRSYGDAAQLAGGVTVDMTALDRIRSIDENTGVALVDAGVTIEQLTRELLPSGWFSPVVPGTNWVTIGGAIASDVHGKNHHRDGSFGSHVRALTLLDASGNVRRLSPEHDAPAFWATIGGMGLTGIILDAEVELRKVPSAAMWATKRRIANLDSLMETMVQVDGDTRYSVAWLDTVSRGRGLGRGVLSYGDHAELENFRPGIDPLGQRKRPTVRVPRTLPNGLINPASVRAFNEVWYRSAPTSSRWGLTSMQTFFYPLDRVELWNRIYGRHGFIQYQFVVPDSGAHLIRVAIERLQRVGAPSFLSVLKRFGAANNGPLSFPTSGWTLALDLPTNVAGLGRALDDLDQEVASLGGRVYLSKDARLRPELLAVMYPRLTEWQQIRAEMGAQGRMESDLSRRLGL